MFSAIEDKINNKILGSGLNKWQFSVPREKSNTAGEGTVIGIINMENTKARTIVENIDDLIDICLPPYDLGCKNKWLKAVSYYRDSMTILRKKTEITQQRSSNSTRYIPVFLVIFG